VECPRIFDTDLDASFCKAIEEGQLARPEPSSQALDPAIGGHPPHGMHDLEGPEHPLDDLARAVLLPPLLGHRSDPTPPRVIDTGIGHQQVLSVLDPQGLIVDQDRDGLPPEDPIHIDPEVVQSNLTLLAHLAPELAKPEDASETARFDETPPGIGQDDFRRHVVEPPLGVLTFVRPMAPELIILHELGVLPIHRLPIGAACHVGIEHPALNGETALGQVLPGMPPRNGSPADAELLKTGT
jgi:hypothetical protein